MTSAQSVTAAPQSSSFVDRVELWGFAAVIGMAVFTQLSIAIAQSLLTIAALCWVALLIVRRERFEAPRFFWPLAVYAGATLIASAFSAQPRASFVDSKQLVLFLIVPIVYRFVSGGRASTLLTVVISAGAASAALGIFQYGLLH